MVFGSVTTWFAFTVLAAELRRVGHGVELLTSAPGGAAGRIGQWCESAIYTEVHVGLSQPAAPGPGLDPLFAEGVVDIQCTDEVSAAVAADPRWSDASRLHKVHGVDPDLPHDKWLQAQLVESLGIAAPRTACDPQGFGDTYIVKPRLGSGGIGVELVTPGRPRPTEDPARPVIFQEFIPGSTLNVVGVARDGEALTSAVLRTGQSNARPTAPSTTVELLDRPDIAAEFVPVIEAMGLSGPFCIDLMLDSQDKPLFLEVNVRFFGSWVAAQAAGVPILESYLALLCGGPRVRPGRQRFGEVFPTALDSWHGVRALAPGSARVVPLRPYLMFAGACETSVADRHAASPPRSPLRPRPVRLSGPTSPTSSRCLP